MDPSYWRYANARGSILQFRLNHITITRRQMLKLLGAARAGALLASCKQPAAEPTKAPTATVAQARAATATPAPKAPVTITYVECWFGIPQFGEVIDPVNQTLSEKMQDEGLDITVRSMVLDDHAKVPDPVCHRCRFHDGVRRAVVQDDQLA